VAKITDIADLIAEARAAGFELRLDGRPIPPALEGADRLLPRLEHRSDEVLAYLVNERSGHEGGPEARAMPARITHRESIAGDLVRLRLEVPPVTSATYTNPGQYCQVQVGSERGYFVLVGEPREPCWDLVLRPSGKVAALLGDPETTSVLVSTALGVGFPLGRIRGHQLAIAVGGTGIAAALPIVRARLRSGDAEITRVYAGVRTERDLPFRSDLERWAAAGVEVVACLSRAEGPLEAEPVGQRTIRLFAGYVQRAMAVDLRERPPVSVVVVGPKPMVQGVREMAPLIALDQRDVRTN
jgi:NAD(P)H-flavin reductase